MKANRPIQVSVLMVNIAAIEMTGYAAFPKELDTDLIRGKLSGLTDKSLQRRITNLSRNKTIEKVALHRCWNREFWCLNLMISFSSSTARNPFFNTGSSYRIANT